MQPYFFEGGAGKKSTVKTPSPVKKPAASNPKGSKSMVVRPSVLSDSSRKSGVMSPRANGKKSMVKAPPADKPRVSFPETKQGKTTAMNNKT